VGQVEKEYEHYGDGDADGDEDADEEQVHTKSLEWKSNCGE